MSKLWFEDIWLYIKDEVSGGFIAKGNTMTISFGKHSSIKISFNQIEIDQGFISISTPVIGKDYTIIKDKNNYYLEKIKNIIINLRNQNESYEKFLNEITRNIFSSNGDNYRILFCNDNLFVKNTITKERVFITHQYKWDTDYDGIHILLTNTKDVDRYINYNSNDIDDIIEAISFNID